MKISKPYNYMNDLLAKQILGCEERKYITIDFINSMLERHGKNAVKEIIFKNVEMPAFVDGFKLTRFDIFCVLDSGENLDIEIQVINYQNLERRSLYYWAKMYVLSLQKGLDYIQLVPTITINLLNYSFLPQKEPHAVYGIYNPKSKHRLTNDLEMHFFELPKFTKKPLKEMSNMERWLAFFFGKTDKGGCGNYECHGNKRCL